MYDCEPASALVQAQRVCDALRDAPLPWMARSG